MSDHDAEPSVQANPAMEVFPATVEEITRRVYMAVGAASVCWESMKGTGVFRDGEACKIADGLIADVLRLTGFGTPSLGCATNSELAQELAVRMAMTEAGAYRTVTS